MVNVLDKDIFIQPAYIVRSCVYRYKVSYQFTGAYVAFIEPMHRNKPHITYLLIHLQTICNYTGQASPY